MRLAATIFLFLPFAARAGDSVPGAHLWPPEPAYAATVIELAVIGPAMFPEPRCDLDPCGDWYQRPRDPAPVPLPFSGLMLAAACGLLWRMTWVSK